MKIEVNDVIKYPVDDVFAAFRDRLEDLSAYLDAIEKITVLSREEKGDKLHVVSLWESKITFPGPIEKLIPMNARRYTDNATWNNDENSVDWRIELAFFTEAIRAEGQNRFEPHGEFTMLKIRGEIDVDPRKITGVPTIVAKRIVPTIVKVIVGNVEKNMKLANRGIERYLAAQPG